MGQSLRLELGDVRKVAVALPEIEAIAYDEDVGDLEAEVVDLHVRKTMNRLVEHHTYFEASWPAGPQVLADVAKSETGIDEILYQEHVLALDALLQVLHDPHHAGCLSRRSVAVESHEIYANRNGDGAHKIGKEDDGAPEHADEKDSRFRVVSGYLLS